MAEFPGNKDIYGECGTKLLCIFKPEQIYIKILNVSMDMQKCICDSVY